MNGAESPCASTSKEVGDFDVTIKLHRDITPVIKVLVRKQGGEEQPAAPVEAAPADESSAVEAPDATPDNGEQAAASEE